jgi:hypothetical protein
MHNTKYLTPLLSLGKSRLVSYRFQNGLQVTRDFGLNFGKIRKEIARVRKENESALPIIAQGERLGSED